ncbi:hypothetical protein MBAV_003258 [Candidatus Magnetobacterium bavaricum]|uniref:Uncharacterized protein n=1 Tax=Candidatus Magnetobacterium bavaricum TaxID=29290 RepID=A0A0F3GRF6_9BACT|nr:hypothetical protein MBAV_003258 [Candidatus Magnetobacterium bavaricum]
MQKYMINDETGKVFQYDQAAVSSNKSLRACTEAEAKSYEATVLKIAPPPEDKKHK